MEHLKMMAFYKRIPEKYFWLIPSLYFMLLGAYDIGSDIPDHTLIWRNALFNAVFFVPLIFRHWISCVLVGCGAACLFGYFLIVLLIWFIQFVAGDHFDNPVDLFGFGFSFCGVSFLLAVVLVRAGIGLYTTKKSVRKAL